MLDFGSPVHKTSLKHNNVTFELSFQAQFLPWGGSRRWLILIRDVQSTPRGIIPHPTISAKLRKHCADFMEEIYAAQA